jgi:hypothetical protein
LRFGLFIKLYGFVTFVAMIADALAFSPVSISVSVDLPQLFLPLK